MSNREVVATAAANRLNLNRVISCRLCAADRASLSGYFISILVQQLYQGNQITAGCDGCDRKAVRLTEGKLPIFKPVGIDIPAIGGIPICERVGNDFRGRCCLGADVWSQAADEQGQQDRELEQVFEFHIAFSLKLNDVEYDVCSSSLHILCSRVG